MKKLMILGCAILALLAVSCNKTKVCRCSVLDSQNVRLIEVSKGTSCESMHYMIYNDTVHVGRMLTDGVICIDYAIPE